MIRPCRLLLSALLALLATASAHATEVTIYRCTDAKGQLALRDMPCRAGEKQEARTMVRPKDPPPRAIPAPAPAATESYGPTPRYVVVTPPQPLYECITPDGERYTSDTSEGHARWEESWMFGYPALPRRGGGSSGSGSGSGSGASASASMGYRSGSGNVSGTVRIGDSNQFRRPVLVPAIPYGQYLYDECNRLPQAEVCGRLRDERHELNRRWNIAQPSERADIDYETRGIDARLANDCGES